MPPNPPKRKERWARRKFFDITYSEIEDEFKQRTYHLYDDDDYDFLAEDLKDVIFEDLTIPERRIFLTYSYYQHAGKTATILKIDSQHIYRIIKEIRNKIKTKYYERISLDYSDSNTY